MVELPPGPVGGESLNALVGQDSHVDLQAEQGEHGQGKHGEDDHVPQVLDGLDHRPNYRLQSFKNWVSTYIFRNKFSLSRAEAKGRKSFKN